MTALEHKAYEDATKKINDCARRRGTLLDLSRLQLTRLPPSLGQLIQLTELDLSHNQLAAVPPELSQLVNLTRLDLSNNQLAGLPPELGHLTALTLLYLSHNRLAGLPPELGHLAKLTRLDLSNNSLAALPPELGHLARLTRCDVSHNQLSGLPAELGALTGLTRLNLSNNRLAGLPTELGALASLTRLDLSNNNIESLPPELCQLASLTVLDLSNNKLGALPPELGALAKLTVLDVSSNSLAGLPPELGALSKLTRLDLTDNRLATLPESLRELGMLDRLLLHDNPALQLSPSVIGPAPRKVADARLATAKAILDFYFARQAGQTRPLNEVKLQVVGCSGAGKTSVVQALRELPFREREVITTGIARCDWPMDTGAGPVTAHVWDFAGQEITHALHPFFFCARSLYVVVLTGRGHHEREDADFWLRQIQAHGTDVHGDGPPVVVVLNQWNVPGCRPEVDRIALRERYPFIRGFVEMDCKAKKGVPALKAALCRELERMPEVREPIPQEWDAVRRALAAGPPPFLGSNEYRALCEAQGVREEGQQDYLAEILHRLGIALNYQNDPGLHEATVLQPEWLTTHLYALLHRAKTQAGVLKQADLEVALQAEKNEAHRACLMQVMQRFELACVLSTASGPAWLVPMALPLAAPVGIEALRDAAGATRLRYSYQTPPDACLTQLIMRRFDFIEEVRERKQLWSRGLVLLRKGARALICLDPLLRQLLITVSGPTKTRLQLSDLCQAELREIHAAFSGLAEPLAETRKQDAWVPVATPETNPPDRSVLEPPAP
ncbi:MAG: COR domain-containing protein [Verrucomicrobiota bacterium]